VTNYEKVRQFMVTFGQEVKDKPKLSNLSTCRLRLALIDEEIGELQDALVNDDLVGTADALADILYVVYGAAAAFGIGIDEIFDEVHDSNMSKLDEDGNPIYNKIGKVMKGPNYFKPKIATLLLKQKGLVWK